MSTEIITRGNWGAQAARKIVAFDPALAEGIVIHHTVTPSDGDLAARVRGIQNYHRNEKGWHDLAYHFLLGLDGSAFEGRGMYRQQGATSTPKLKQFDYSTQYANRRYYAVSFIGNFEEEQLSQAAIRTFVSLRHDMMEAGCGPDVKFHSDFKINAQGGALTACPGRNVRNNLKALSASRLSLQGEADDDLVEDQLKAWNQVRTISDTDFASVRLQRINQIARSNIFALRKLR